jgi:hypothetical protein
MSLPPREVKAHLRERRGKGRQQSDGPGEQLSLIE